VLIIGFSPAADYPSVFIPKLRFFAREIVSAFA